MGKFSLAAGAACAGLAAVLGAQPLSFGIKGGIPVTGAVEGSYGVRPEARRYTVGAVVEVRLPRSFALEADALYGRTGYGASDEAFGMTTETRVRANAWEFPVFAKRYLGSRALPARLFVSAGVVIRKLSGVEETVHTFGRNPATGEPFDSTYQADTLGLLQDNPSTGVVAAGGVRLRVGRLLIAPEVRYTRWLGRPFDEQGSRGSFVRSSANRVEALAGITF